MVDIKTEYKIGKIRCDMLVNADFKYAEGNYISCNAFIDNFLQTIDEKSKAGKMIIQEFDKIYDDIMLQFRELAGSKKNVGSLESIDIDTTGREKIEIELISKKKEVCWRISMTEGLFNE